MSYIFYSPNLIKPKIDYFSSANNLLTVELPIFKFTNMFSKALIMLLTYTVYYLMLGNISNKF